MVPIPLPRIVHFPSFDKSNKPDICNILVGSFFISRVYWWLQLQVSQLYCYFPAAKYFCCCNPIKNPPQFWRMNACSCLPRPSFTKVTQEWANLRYHRTSHFHFHFYGISRLQHAQHFIHSSNFQKQHNYFSYKYSVL